MEWIANKTQEGMRVEIMTLQAELKTLVGEKKKSLESSGTVKVEWQ